MHFKQSGRKICLIFKEQYEFTSILAQVPLDVAVNVEKSHEDKIVANSVVWKTLTLGVPYMFGEKKNWEKPKKLLISHYNIGSKNQ